MNIIDLLRKINGYIAIKLHKKSLSCDEQNNYLVKFNEPKNDIERSYYQYRCQIHKDENIIIFIVKNIVSFFLIYIYIFKSTKKIKIDNEFIDKKYNILMMDDKRIDFLPDSLNNNIKQIGLSQICVLDKNDRKFLKKIIKKYPFSYLFIFKNMIKIATYSGAIKSYEPNQIICSCEESFTSSILTYYCELNNVKHINIMHGEKLFNIREAFCRFHEFYVCDNHYIELFKKLRVNKCKFIIELPPSMKLDVQKYKIMEDEKCDYKFYLEIETKEKLDKLKEAVDILTSSGKKVILRPHPLYTDTKLLKKYFCDIQIENSNDVEIGLSIAKTKNVVARFSTVLNQALNCKTGIIIDDYSDKKTYESLLEKNYIMLNKPHLLLTEIISSIDRNND